MGKSFLKKIFKPVKSAGKWTTHAAEDTFHWTEKTVGNVGKKVLTFADNQTSKITDLLSNPTLLLVVGGVVVCVIMLKS